MYSFYLPIRDVNTNRLIYTYYNAADPWVSGMVGIKQIIKKKLNQLLFYLIGFFVFQNIFLFKLNFKFFSFSKNLVLRYLYLLKYRELIVRGNIHLP